MVRCRLDEYAIEKTGLEQIAGHRAIERDTARKSEVPMTGRLAKVADKVECDRFQSLLQRRGEVLVLPRKWCAPAASRIRGQSFYEPALVNAPSPFAQ